MAATHLAAARRSICVGFFGLGTFMGMWGVMIPERVASLGLSELTLGLFLLVIGLSLCAAIFCVNRFVIFQDAVQLIRVISAIYVLGFAVVLTTGSVMMLFLIGIVTGFAAGFVDAGLNSQASEWEQHSGRRGMSFFHALFSLGSLSGAALLTLMLSLDLPVKWVIYGSAVLVGGGLAMRRQWVGTQTIAGTAANADIDVGADNSGSPAADTAAERLPLPVVLFLGLCIALATLSEGGALDWSALHMNRVMGLSVSEAGQTVVLFSIAIAAVRFAGDWLANRFPVHLIMAVPMMLAGIMLFAAVLLGQVAVLMAAYVIFGLAIGNAFPIIISQAGSAAGGDRLRDISIVVGFAYVGLITGPALLGVIAHFAGLDATIITLAGAAMILGCLVMTMPRFVPPPQPDQDGVELVKTDQG